MQQIPCEKCGQLTPNHDVVNYGSMDKGHKQLCGRCFNSEIAKSCGLDDFKHIEFEPVVLTDCTGRTHEFHFRVRLYGNIVTLDAFELRDDSPAGYQFQVIAGPEDDLLALLGRLIEKIRRALAVKHLSDGRYGIELADHHIVRGLINYDDAFAERVPLLVIDGRDITWNEFGRMLMTFEGFQFKLEIRDKSQDV